VAPAVGTERWQGSKLDTEFHRAQTEFRREIKQRFAQGTLADDASARSQ
jgi:hypothetical protein